MMAFVNLAIYAVDTSSIYAAEDMHSAALSLSWTVVAAGNIRICLLLVFFVYSVTQKWRDAEYTTLRNLWWPGSTWVLSHTLPSLFCAGAGALYVHVTASRLVLAICVFQC